MRSKSNFLRTDQTLKKKTKKITKTKQQKQKKKKKESKLHLSKDFPFPVAFFALQILTTPNGCRRPLNFVNTFLRVQK